MGVPNGCRLDTDVCVVGSGPAGVTLAKLLAPRFHVVVIPGGEKRRSSQATSLYRGETVGDAYGRLEHLRSRQFGGTSNLWCIRLGDGSIGVRYVPFDPIDFEARSWIPHSGWPISRADLNPYYRRAHEQLRIGSFAYDNEDENPGIHTLEALGLEASLFRFGPSDVFLDPEINGLGSHQNIDVLLGAHAVDLTTTSSRDHVDEVKVATLQGRRFTVRAKRVVVAAGGIESARILLSAQGGRGIGSSRALGRYYMDHYLVPMARWHFRNPQEMRALSYFDLRRVLDRSGTAPVMGKISLGRQLQIRDRLVNACISLLPLAAEKDLRAVQGVKKVFESVRTRRPRDVVSGAQEALKRLGYVKVALRDRLQSGVGLIPGFAKGGWSRLERLDWRFQDFELFAFLEQTPNPHNRIELGEERDALGVRRVRLNWRWNELDIDSMKRTQGFLAEAWNRSGYGETNLAPYQRFYERDRYATLAHHMGATRMHESPEFGVVDANLRVHGTDNLYVASSSVFPTGSYANPTLTIVALAHRLADHIKAENYAARIPVSSPSTAAHP